MCFESECVPLQRLYDANICRHKRRQEQLFDRLLGLPVHVDLYMVQIVHAAVCRQVHALQRKRCEAPTQNVLCLELYLRHSVRERNQQCKAHVWVRWSDCDRRRTPCHGYKVSKAKPFSPRLTSAFDSPSATNMTSFAALMTGMVMVMRSGGGLGLLDTGSTHPLVAAV